MSNISKVVVEFLEMPRGIRVAADLEELHANLPRRSFESVQLLRSLDENAFNVVTWRAVRNTDNVDRLRCPWLSLVARKVLLEHLVQPFPCRRCSSRLDGLEYVSHGVRISYVGILLRMVEEEDVNAVSVIGRANRRDHHDSVGGLTPQAAGH